MRKTDVFKIGDLAQLAGMERLQKLDGWEKGNEVIHIRNGSGLTFDVQMDRGMDIGLCELNGVPVSWISPSGFVSPSHFNPYEREWEKTFGGGLLTTCGLQSAGKPSDIDGTHYGLHGNISHTPAELIEKNGWWEGEEYVQKITGRMVENIQLGETFELQRSLKTYSLRPAIEITDRVTNCSFHDHHHAMMYHLNFGFPFLSETTEIGLPQSEIESIKGEIDPKRLNTFPKPQDSDDPNVQLHHIKNFQASKTHISNYIDSLQKKLHAEVIWDGTSMPNLTQWRYPHKGKYVMALEPGNVSTKGRKTLIEEGKMPVLKAQATIQYTIKINFSWEETLL